MGYLVDVALNGQQFTGKPVNFRYYDVKITDIEPGVGPSIGGTNIKINGKGLYDAGVKRIRFTSEDGKGIREVVADWDKKLKCLRVTVPAYKWLFIDEEDDPSDAQDQNENPTEKKAALLKQSVKVLLTLNNQEWINALCFNYHDVEIQRVSYAT